MEPVTTEGRLPWFREHSPDGHPLWVAEIDGAIAGWFSFHSFITRCAYRGTAEVSGVYVGESCRRRGVARSLLEEAIARSPQLGITVLVGCIFGHNEPSLKLFERFGFQRWGFLPRIARLDGVARDLVIMVATFKIGEHQGDLLDQSQNVILSHRLAHHADLFVFRGHLQK